MEDHVNVMHTIVKSAFYVSVLQMKLPCSLHSLLVLFDDGRSDIYVPADINQNDYTENFPGK